MKANARECVRSLLVGVFLTGWTHCAVAATTIDMMIVYDTTATSWVSTNGGMQLFAENAVAKMSQAMGNSGVDVTFRLVHAASVSYTHLNFGADLDNLHSGIGKLSDVHEWRDMYDADLVAMFVDTGSAYDFVGLGHLLVSKDGMPNEAFTVNAIRSVDISHTLTHEVGHNLGCHHSKYQKSDPGPNKAINTYYAGWYFTGDDDIKYHTIMSYNSDGYGSLYYPAPLFSTPLVTYQGTPVGHVKDGDNARTISEMKDVIASYRGRPGGRPAVPSNVSASDGTSINKITVKWGAADGATNYHIYRYMFCDQFEARRIGTSSSTSFDDVTAEANNTYYYWVKAENAAGASCFSKPDTGYLGVIGPLITLNGMAGNNIIPSTRPLPWTWQVNLRVISGFQWIGGWRLILSSGLWFYFNSNMNLVPFDGNLANCRPAYQELYNVQPLTLVKNLSLPAGTYNVWFAVDYPMDGGLNLTPGYYLLNSLTVEVE